MPAVVGTRIVLQDGQGRERAVLDLDSNNMVQFTVVAQNGRQAVNIHESFDGDGVLYLNGDNCAIEMNAEGKSPSLGIISGGTMPVTLDKSGLHTHAAPRPAQGAPRGDAFLRLLAEATDLAASAYPGTQFYEADGTPAGGQGTKPEDVSEWRFVYNHHPQGQKQGTVFVYYRAGAFEQPTRVLYPWLEDVLIPLPIQLGLAEAIALKNQAGYTGPFTSVVLRWPLYPGVEEPSYIFNVSHVGYVFVGVYSRRVTTQRVRSQTR
jgi:hypothetical protein